MLSLSFGFTAAMNINLVNFDKLSLLKIAIRHFTKHFRQKQDS